MAYRTTAERKLDEQVGALLARGRTAGLYGVTFAALLLVIPAVARFLLTLELDRFVSPGFIRASATAAMLISRFGAVTGIAGALMCSALAAVVMIRSSVLRRVR